eukprot:5806689-Lingulodinium_polyedra.AAC.1
MQGLEEESKAVPPLCMSSVNLGATYLDAFEMWAKDKAFRGKESLQERRKDALSTPLPLTKARQAQLQAVLEWEPSHPAMPEWAHQVAKHRA